MEFKWKQNVDASWSLVCVPVSFAGPITDKVSLLYPNHVATAYKAGGGWMGVAYATDKNPDPIIFSDIEHLEEIKHLLETTVALRQG